jgi:hypothetical protein
MSDVTNQISEAYCFGCVYYPPNLPPHAYSEADWAMLQARTCSFEHAPGTTDCLASRKTSCSLVDLDAMRQSPVGRAE